MLYEVITNTLGDYVITYNVSDAAGNPADEVTRTVHVVEPGTVNEPLYRVNAGGPTLMGPEPDFLGLEASPVITSYSIHYTKLYEFSFVLIVLMCNSLISPP